MREEITLSRLTAVRRDDVDFVGVVRPMDHALASAPTPPRSDRDYVSVLDGPLALNSEKFGPEVED
jgi:hypothetical protein